jgi:hypothetical protein
MMKDMFKALKPASQPSEPLKIVHATQKPGKGQEETKTWFLATKKDKLYVAAQKGSLSASAIERADLSTFTDVPAQKFDPANLYPEPKPSYHRFRYREGENDDDVFKKYRAPLQVAIDAEGAEVLLHEYTALLTKREVETCEILRVIPHNNNAKYRV